MALRSALQARNAHLLVHNLVPRCVLSSAHQAVQVAPLVTSAAVAPQRQVFGRWKPVASRVGFTKEMSIYTEGQSLKVLRVGSSLHAYSIIVTLLFQRFFSGLT